jgi:hypothetical protein
MIRRAPLRQTHYYPLFGNYNGPFIFQQDVVPTFGDE